jgi:hypothetical protein
LSKYFNDFNEKEETCAGDLEKEKLRFNNQMYKKKLYTQLEELLIEVL